MAENNLPLNAGQMGVLSTATGTVRPVSADELKSLSKDKSLSSMSQAELKEVADQIKIQDEDLPPEYRAVGTGGTVPSITDIKNLDPEKQKEVLGLVEKLLKDMKDSKSETKAEVKPQIKEEPKVDKPPMDLLPTDIPVHITDQHRDKFLRALVSGAAYEWSYDVVPGHFTVSFRTLEVKEHDAITDALRLLSDKRPFDNFAQVRLMHMRLLISTSISAYSVVREDTTEKTTTFPSPLVEFIEMGSKLPVKENKGLTIKKPEPITPGEMILLANEHRFSEVNSVLYNLFVEYFSRFEREVAALSKELTDPNFSKGNRGRTSS